MSILNSVVETEVSGWLSQGWGCTNEWKSVGKVPQKSCRVLCVFVTISQSQNPYHFSLSCCEKVAKGPEDGIWAADLLEIFGCVCPLLLRLMSDRIDPGSLELFHSGIGDVVCSL